jgi:hypothetical protein
MNTPWGKADTVTEIGDVGGLKILSVSTPTHGGIYVPEELCHPIPSRERLWAKRWSGSICWYEEDCCWAAVAVAFPQFFAADEVEAAKRVVADHCKPGPGYCILCGQEPCTCTSLSERRKP